MLQASFRTRAATRGQTLPTSGLSSTYRMEPQLNDLIGRPVHIDIATVGLPTLTLCRQGIFTSDKLF